MAEADVLCDLSEAEALAPEWDELAVADGQPLASPAWMLGWWRHAAPARAALRIVAVREGGKLVGLAPFYVSGGAYRLLADVLAASIAPLARAGREWDVAEAVARTLAAGVPRAEAVLLERLPVASPWLTALREAWPGRARPLALRHKLLLIPTITLAGSYDDWLAARSGKFRNAARRYERRFAAAGGTHRLATTDTVATDVATFMALHRARWERRDAGSHILALGDRFAALMRDVAAVHLASGRFRLFILEIDGEPAGASLAVAAGGEVAGYNAGWDERFRELSPGRLSQLRTIRDAFERGDRRLSMGWGLLDHKRPFADAIEAVAWDLLVPVGSGLPAAVARFGPRVVAGRLGPSLKRNLSDEHVARLQEVRERARAAGSASLRARGDRRTRGPA